MEPVEPYIGEIRMFGGSVVPSGFAFCNGQQLSISQNGPLFSLIGTTYGGDGSTYFNLPDLRCRVPLHWGAKHPTGESGGQQQVILTQENLPAHTHTVTADGTGGSDNPAGNSWGDAKQPVYSAPVTPVQSMNSGCFTTSGGGGAHDNMIPYVGVSYIIALVGIYPSRSEESE